MLLERFTEGAVERVAEERGAVDALREGVATALLRLDVERVVVDTALLREDDVPLLTEVFRVAVPRVAALSALLRTLLLPKVRDAVAVLRLETRVAAPLLSVPTRESLALRTAVWRLRSKERALV